MKGIEIKGKDFINILNKMKGDYNCDIITFVQNHIMKHLFNLLDEIETGDEFTKERIIELLRTNKKLFIEAKQSTYQDIINLYQVEENIPFENEFGLSEIVYFDLDKKDIRDDISENIYINFFLYGRMKENDWFIKIKRRTDSYYLKDEFNIYFDEIIK